MGVDCDKVLLKLLQIKQLVNDPGSTSPVSMNQTTAYYAEEKRYVDTRVGLASNTYVYQEDEVSEIRLQDTSGYSKSNTNTNTTAKQNNKWNVIGEKETTPVGEHHFNDIFQNLMCYADSPEKFNLLSRCNQDFVYSVETFCKIIISERNLPVDQKTIKPVSIGGIAGGEKFIHRGILFKYAVDVLLKKDPNTGQCLYMYGGPSRNDELAMKAAGNELKALHRFASAAQKVKGVFTPLMSLCDFHGFRLIAMSLLPISKETIAYGSSDAGEHVHNDEPQLSEKMKQIAQILNLKPHLVRDKLIYGPGDIEGHKGMDGKFYALDFGRLYPPEAPSQNPDERVPRAIFYKHLRPELVKSNPDAFSSWQRDDPEKEQNNKEVEATTTRLMTEIIPNFAKELNEGKYSKQEWPVYAHRKGINCRHFGLVRSCSNSKQFWLTEMWIRSLKHVVYRQLRSHSALERFLSDITAKQLIADILNLVMVPGTKFHKWYWTSTEENCPKDIAVGATDDLENILKVPSHGLSRNSETLSLTEVAFAIPSMKFSVQQQFGRIALQEHEKKEEADLCNSVFALDGVARLSEISSFKISPRSYPQINEAKNFYFLDSDIVSVEPKIKYASLIHFADGYTSLHKALYLSKGTECKVLKPSLRLLEDATRKLRLSWQMVPEDEDVLYHFGNASCLYAVGLQIKHSKKSKKDEENARLAFMDGTDSLERVLVMYKEEHEKATTNNNGNTEEISMRSRIGECHQRLCDTYIWQGIVTTRQYKMIHSRDNSFQRASYHFEEATKLEAGSMDFLLVDAFQNMEKHRAAVFVHMCLVSTYVKNYLQNFVKSHKEMFSRIDLSNGAEDVPFLVTDIHIGLFLELFGEAKIKSINLMHCSCLTENAVLTILKQFGEHLEELYISHICLGENTIHALQACKSLKVLHMKHCNLNDAVIRKLLPGLWISKEHIASVLLSLEDVSLEGNKEVTGESLVPLVKKCTQLKKLQVKNCGANEAAINELKKIKPQMELQYTVGDSGISDPVKAVS